MRRLNELLHSHKIYFFFFPFLFSRKEKCVLAAQVCISLRLKMPRFLHEFVGCSAISCPTRALSLYLSFFLSLVFRMCPLFLPFFHSLSLSCVPRVPSLSFFIFLSLSLVSHTCPLKAPLGARPPPVEGNTRAPLSSTWSTAAQVGLNSCLFFVRRGKSPQRQTEGQSVYFRWMQQGAPLRCGCSTDRRGQECTVPFSHSAAKEWSIRNSFG